MKASSKTIKILVLSACALLFSSLVHAQTVKWDSTFRPPSFNLKLGVFKSYPNSPKDVIFLGNSITAGVDWAELLQMPNAKNRGISGDITFGVLERLDEVIEGRPAKVFILIGINDISRNIPDSIILDNYCKILDRIKTGSPATHVFVQTLLPTNNSFKKFENHYNKEAHILWLNKQLKVAAKNRNVRVVDLYPNFLDQGKQLDANYTEDGLHLNALGYAKWKKILIEGGFLK